MFDVVDCQHPLVAAGPDGSVWIDADLSGCVVLGPLCVGAIVRGAFDLGETGDSSDLDSRRLGVDVLLTAEWPLRLGTVVLSPGVGFGAGWLRSSYAGGRGPDDIGVDAGGLRAEARLGVRIPVRGRFALDVGAFFDVSPLAHTGSYSEDGVRIAGVPRWRAGVGVGVRYGGP